MSDVKTLYRRDFVLWSQEQAAALRSGASGGSNQSIDWENVAEEIESLGVSQRSELKSQIRRVIEHLLKLQYSGAADPRAGWAASITDARNAIERVIEDSPSLRSEVAAAIAAETGRGSRKPIKQRGRRSRSSVTGCLPIRPAATNKRSHIEGDIGPPASYITCS